MVKTRERELYELAIVADGCSEDFFYSSNFELFTAEIFAENRV